MTRIIKQRFISVAACSVLIIGAHTVRAETLDCPQTLDFGTFASCGASHSATVSPTGTISATGCLTPLGGHAPGRCRLGDITDISVITISTDATLGGSQGGSMNIDQFMLRPLNGGTNAATLDVTSDMIGTDLDFTVGATLHIDGAQTGGVYNGAYILTVNFP